MGTMLVLCAFTSAYALHNPLESMRQATRLPAATLSISRWSFPWDSGATAYTSRLEGRLLSSIGNVRETLRVFEQLERAATPDNNLLTSPAAALLDGRWRLEATVAAQACGSYFGVRQGVRVGSVR